jgi:ubiquitin-protein ligase
MYSKNLSTKRINNDIKEIYKNPIEGIGIISLDNDIKKYIVNIMLMSGPYKNYCLQLLLTFPDDYPINPPKVLIYPGQLFDNLYHRHVFNDDSKDEDGLCFRKLCLDLLANDFMSTKNENTGWNPSYTISTLLMQLQIFLSNPDLSINSMPKDYQIKELMESMNNYQRKFIIKNDKGEYNITHTWKDPYPKMYFKSDIERINKNIIEDNKNKLMKENLTCYILKTNIFDETNIILGYPIIKENDIFYPIPEILSYEGYLTQLSKEEFDRFYISNSLKSANNKYYHA